MYTETDPSEAASDCRLMSVWAWAGAMIIWLTGVQHWAGGRSLLSMIFAVVQVFWADNPRDLQLLRHDKSLHTIKTKPHLSDVPDYLGLWWTPCVSTRTTPSRPRPFVVSTQLGLELAFGNCLIYDHSNRTTASFSLWIHHNYKDNKLPTMPRPLQLDANRQNMSFRLELWCDDES